MPKEETNVCWFNYWNFDYLYLLFTGWFGIRKSFSQFLLSALPFLQEYGNISYHTENGQNVPVLDQNVRLNEFDKNDKRSKKALNKKNDLLKPVVPIISIDIPD